MGISLMGQIESAKWGSGGVQMTGETSHHVTSHWSLGFIPSSLRPAKPWDLEREKWRKREESTLSLSREGRAVAPEALENMPAPRVLGKP